MQNCYRLNTQKIRRWDGNASGGDLAQTNSRGATITSLQLSNISFYTDFVGMPEAINSYTGVSTGVKGFDFRPVLRDNIPILVNEKGVPITEINNSYRQ